MSKLIHAAALTLLAAPAFADGHIATGNAEAGAAQFDRQCVACHVARDADGNVVAGRTARTGPNLFGIVGQQIASDPDFRYGDSIVTLGATGAVWTEDAFAGYVQDPTSWLRMALDDNRARGKMAYRVRDETDAIDIFAYLATLGAAE